MILFHTGNSSFFIPNFLSGYGVIFFYNKTNIKEIKGESKKEHNLAFYFWKI